MKKTLVAVAALAAVAGAHAQATISGMVQTGVNRTTTTTTGASTSAITLEDSNGNTGINVGVKEDLGGGLAFEGNIAFTNPLSSGATTASAGYQTFGGLSGGFGNLKAGALYTPQFVALIKGDASGYLINNPVAQITQHQGADIGSTTLSTASMVQYTLPTIASGLTLQFAQKMGGQTNGTRDASFYHINYAAGGLDAGYVYSTYKYSAALTDTASNLYGSYDFGPAKLYMMIAQADTGGDLGVSGNSIGVGIPMGAFTLTYNYGSTNGAIINGVAGASARDASSVKQAGNYFGVSYALSKRTTAYAAYYKQTGNNLSATAQAVATTNASATTRLMLMHSF